MPSLVGRQGQQRREGSGRGWKIVAAKCIGPLLVESALPWAAAVTDTIGFAINDDETIDDRPCRQVIQQVAHVEFERSVGQGLQRLLPVVEQRVRELRAAGSCPLSAQQGG